MLEARIAAFPSRSVSVGGRALAYREAGQGPALVLLHGIGSGSASWLFQLEELAAGYRVIAWDAPGYGDSDAFAIDAPRPEDYARALAVLLGAGSMAALDGWPAVIAGVTPGMPTFGEKFANRLVLSGDADNPSMIYISEFENPENYTPGEGATSAGAIQVSPGDGEAITGLRTLFLPLENEEVLVIFKERSTYMLTGNDADTFTLQKVSGEFGAVSVVSGHIRGQTNTMPLHIEILYNEFDSTAAFAVSSLLAGLALVTLVLKFWLESRHADGLARAHRRQ